MMQRQNKWNSHCTKPANVCSFIASTNAVTSMRRSPHRGFGKLGGWKRRAGKSGPVLPLQATVGELLLRSKVSEGRIRLEKSNAVHLGGTQPLQAREKSKDRVAGRGTWHCC